MAKARASKPTRSASEKIDHSLAAAALEKQKRGETPTREERAALRRYEKARDEELRREHYRTIRKKDWREWSGRQVKVLNEQSARYGLPIGGATIDLPAVVEWLHDFLAANARKLAGPDDEDPALAGKTSPALERYRIAKAKREELAYKRDLGEWIPRKDVHAGLALFIPILRRAGETLQRQYGSGAHNILDEAIVNAIDTLQHHFGPDDGPADGTATDQPGR